MALHCRWHAVHSRRLRAFTLRTGPSSRRHIADRGEKRRGDTGSRTTNGCTFRVLLHIALCMCVAFFVCLPGGAFRPTSHPTWCSAWWATDPRTGGGGGPEGVWDGVCHGWWASCNWGPPFIGGIHFVYFISQQHHELGSPLLSVGDPIFPLSAVHCLPPSPCSGLFASFLQ